ncbi:MAG TPA: hypothetical protein VGR28_06845 [Candidatus Thermoplasmatota archaeon]|nr:hypothetical protein [Candidatus Thermoplasmatota archaeon]
MSRSSNKATTRRRRHPSETSRAADVRGHASAAGSRRRSKQGA